MKRFVTVLIVLALVGGAGALWYNYSKNSGKISVFTSKAVGKSDITSTVTATGTLAAVTEVSVGSEVSGVIQKIYVDYNSKVKKGQLLAQLNPTTLQTQVDKARANLQKTQSSYDSVVAELGNASADVKRMQANALSSQAKVKQAESQVANAKASVFTAEANVRKSEAEFEKNEIDYERMKTLRDQDLIAQTDLDTSKANYLTSKAGLEASKADLRGAKASYDSSVLSLESTKSDFEASKIQVEAAEQQLLSAQASVRGAQADVEQAKANLDSALVDLGKTKICSPSDGIVLAVAVSEGQTVAAQYQAPELFTLANNLEEMQVEASVDEADIGQVKVGSEVIFTVDTWPDREFKGCVTEVRQSASTVNNVVTYPVIISAENPDLCLMPGMTATVAITVQERHDILTVPNSALRFNPGESERENVVNEDADEDGNRDDKLSNNKDDKKVNPAQKTVYTLVKGQPGKIKKHYITTGITDGTDTEVTSGDLEQGMRVVTGSTEVEKSKAARRRTGGPRRPGPF